MSRRDNEIEGRMVRKLEGVRMRRGEEGETACGGREEGKVGATE